MTAPLPATGTRVRAAAPRWLGICGLLLSVAAVAVADTAPADSVFDVRLVSQADQFTEAEALARFEAPANRPYRIGPGDHLSIQVWDQPGLSGQHVVGPDGIITLPVAGDLHVADLGRQEALAALVDLLAPYYPDAVVTLRIDLYQSNSVYVLGRVLNPGMVTFDATPTILEAITRAGGLPVGGMGAEEVRLTRCAVLRGRERMVWIDLRQLLTGNMALNIRLQPGDVVYIPDSADQLVYVLGEVREPGAIRLSPEMSLLDALSLAGGPTVDAAVGSMQLIRASDRARTRVSLGDLREPQPERNLLLEQNDILYVPRRGIARVDYWMSKLNPFATMLLLGAAATR